MRRYEQEPIHLLEQEKRLSDRGPTYSYAVTPPGGAGDMKHAKSGISLLFWPAGWTQPWGQPGEFEYHTLHEEIFFLSGTMHFDKYYTVKTLGYINHPPFWKHATNFYVDKNDGELTMLMRSGSQPIVQNEKVPDNWDGRPTFASPTRSIGTRNLQLDDLSWVPLISANGAKTGLEAKRVAEDRDDGWTTWVMRAPAGWMSQGPLIERPGGDEIYVIEGDLELPNRNGAVLNRSGYFCQATKISDGAGTMASRKGALFVRWTKNADQIWRVAPQV